LETTRINDYSPSDYECIGELEQLKIEFDSFDVDEWKYVFAIHKFGIEAIIAKLNILNGEYKLLKDYNPIEQIDSRVKDPAATVKKLQKLGLEISPQSAKDSLHDIGGIRVICSFKDDIYVIRENLMKQSDLLIVGEKDYIKNPKPNGYRSLHLLIEVPVFMIEKRETVVIEVQIRSVAMDVWARLEHKLYYKKNIAIPQHLIDELAECAELTNMLDEKMQHIRAEVAPYFSEKEEMLKIGFGSWLD